MKQLQTVLFLIIPLFPSLSAQQIWHNTSLVGGFALGAQDRRLFNYPDAENVLQQEKENLDYDLCLFLQKRLFKYGLFQLDAGVGYAESNTFFSRPYDQSKISCETSLELRHFKKYTLNKLILPLSTRLYLHKNRKYFVQCSAFPAACFRKRAKDNKRFAKWQFEPNSLEINPALGCRLNQKMQLVLYYRLFSYREVDAVIFSQALYNEPVPPFLEQKVDKYNPFKMWITVEYALGG